MSHDHFFWNSFHFMIENLPHIRHSMCIIPADGTILLNQILLKYDQSLNDWSSAYMNVCFSRRETGELWFKSLKPDEQVEIEEEGEATYA
jgi:hypothetical protein